MSHSKLIKLFLISLLWLSMSCENGCQKKDLAPKKSASVFFDNLKNNDEVTSPLKVSFGLTGMTVRPALEDVHDKTSGHHHILIDHPRGFIDKGLPIPADPRHIHYGKGETSAVVELPPGVHTLSMQFGDGAHLSYGKEMSATITVRVIEQAAIETETEE